MGRMEGAKVGHGIGIMVRVTLNYFFVNWGRFGFFATLKTMDHCTNYAILPAENAVLADRFCSGCGQLQGGKTMASLSAISRGSWAIPLMILVMNGALPVVA